MKMTNPINALIRSHWQVQTLSVPTTHDPRSWLEKQAQDCELKWLLAYTTDGILWGVMQHNTLLLANDTNMFDLPGRHLQWHRLQQVRLFGQAGELTLWHGPVFSSPGQPACWQASLLSDQQDTSAAEAAFDEELLLWGWGSEQRGPFVRLVEGQQGIVHHPPVNRAVDERFRARLRVRQQLSIDSKTGMWQVVGSRLVEVR